MPTTILSRSIGIVSTSTSALNFPLCISPRSYMDDRNGNFLSFRWHFKPDDGIETLDYDVASRLSEEDPDYLEG